MSTVLDSEAMQRMTTLVEEAARSTEEGVKYFVEPGEGTLTRATSRRHHLVFGRRGSGKSSLLRKARAQLVVNRRPISYVDLEAYKGHAYPDVLLSVLISTFAGFKDWLDGAAINPANKTTFWKRFFGIAPTKPAYNRTRCQALSDRLTKIGKDLRDQLHLPDAAEIQVRSGQAESETVEFKAEVTAGLSTIGASGSGATGESRSQNVEAQEVFRRSKIDFLYRHIIDYQEVFKDMAALSAGDAYLFLDDLYHIRRADQANVVDYFHRIAKAGALWLKVGTVRHRSKWYVHGDPPRGLKMGDDADEINLDLTLEKYPLARRFLQSILTNLATTCSLSHIDDFITDTAISRLVLASGGVARDFLTIFRRAVDVARQRAGGRGRGEKIGVEDVNVAAGEHDNAKREEFNYEAGEDSTNLNAAFKRIRSFCLDEANSNCFLVAKDSSGPEIDLLHELVDLKLLHLVRGRVTVSDRKGQIFEAYMLDVSQYAGTRKKRDLREVEFWRDEEQLRRVSMIYEPSA